MSSTHDVRIGRPAAQELPPPGVPAWEKSCGAPPARQLGHATLELLVEEWSIPILRELLGGPLRPRELERRLPRAAHSAVMRRLAKMHAGGAVVRERHAELPPRAHYALTTHGRRILDVVEVATRWERSWTLGGGDGIDALRLIGDERVREIILVLAQEPASVAQLHDRLPHAQARSSLRERLATLTGAEVLARGERSGQASYSLTASARELALVEVAAARWEWETLPSVHRVDARDVAGVVHLFAPTARLPTALDGVCRVRVDGNREGQQLDVYLAASGRSVATLEQPCPVQAACSATPHGWCDALLLGRWDGVSTGGDRALAAATLASLGAAMAA